jgi:hypothetical protein
VIALLVFVVCALAITSLVILARVLDADAWRRELTIYRLRFPRGLTADQVVSWLATLPPPGRGPLGRPPLALDIVATDGGIKHRLAIPASNAEALTAQLQTALPGIRLEVLKGDVLPRTMQAVELRATSRVFPMAVDRVEAGAAALLASLQPLGARELVHVQWLVRAAPVPAVPRRRDAPAVLASDAPVRDGEDLQGLRRKQVEPLLHVVGRIGVSAGSGARRHHLLARVQAALSVMAAPGMRLSASWLPSSLASERLRRRVLPLLGWGAVINGREAAGLLGVPLGDLALPGLEVGAARQLPVSPRTLDRGVLLGVSDHPGTLGRELRLETDDRLRHLHLIGPTGAGKSTLMARMVLDDLEAGRGLVVVDPKRDLVETILARLPEHRAKDVIVLDPVDTARPVGLNVLAREGDSEAERELVAENLLGVFQNLWKDSWGPRSDDILRASLLTLCSAKAADGSAFTLVELPELLTSTRFRKYVLGQESIPEHVRGFWQWFDGSSPFERSQALAPVLNKVRAFTMRTPVRLLLGQPAGIDLQRVLDDRAVVLVPLSAGELGKPAAELLGSLIVAAVWQTIRSRTAVPADEREPVFVYLDEFQDVLRLPLDLADLLAQARGLSAGLTLAHQHLGQLPKDVRSAVLATARSQAVFQVSADDAAVLARGFSPVLEAADLMGLDGFHFALRPVWRSQVVRAVTGRSLPLESAPDERRDRAASRERFGVPRAEVEAAQRARLQATGAPPVPLGRRRKAASK